LIGILVCFDRDIDAPIGESVITLLHSTILYFTPTLSLFIKIANDQLTNHKKFLQVRQTWEFSETFTMFIDKWNERELLLSQDILFKTFSYHHRSS